MKLGSVKHSCSCTGFGHLDTSCTPWGDLDTLQQKNLPVPDHSHSPFEMDGGYFDDSTSGWDFTKCLVVVEFSAGF